MASDDLRAAILARVQKLREEAEEEPEEEDDGVGGATDIMCGCSDEFITIGEDIVCVHLILPYVLDGTIQYNIVQLDDGEPAKEPLFFTYECWENVGEDLGEAVEDLPPVVEQGAILDCDYCGSSIRMGEFCASVHLGEITLSERLTNTTTFIMSDDTPYVICIACIRLMISSSIDRFEPIEQWGDVSQNGECLTCTSARCWRVGVCLCKCHRIR